MKIHFYGPLLEKTGMAVRARYLFKVLNEKHEVKAMNVNTNNISKRVNETDVMNILSSFHKDIQNPDITIQYVIPPMFVKHPNTHNIGIVSWVTNSLPSRDLDFGNGMPPHMNNWVKQCALMDEIWTFSESTKNALIKVGIKNVHIAPVGIDEELWKSSTETKDLNLLNIDCDEYGNKIENKKFVVGCVADWNEHKNLEPFVICSILGLDPKRTTIVLKSNDFITGKKIADHVKDIKESLVIKHTVPVTIIEEDLSEEEMVALYKKFDLFVNLSKGEGVGLTTLQALLMNKDVLVSRNSAHEDYITNPEQFVSCIGGLARSKMRNPWYQNDQIWGIFNEIEYVQKLQKKYTEWNNQRIYYGDNLRKSIIKGYSKTALSEFVNKRLQRT